MVCPCKYPLVIKKDGIDFLAFPLDVIEANGGEMPVPLIYPFKDDNGLEWMIVEYKEEHAGVKRYVSSGHIHYAGCNEESIECDSKAIFSTWHPKEEWEKEHKIIM